MPKNKTKTDTRFNPMANPLENTPDTNAALNPNAPTFSVPPPIVQPPFISAALQDLVRPIVEQTLAANNNNNQLVDETINDIANLPDLDKIPDIVKSIREFSGDPTEYNSWKRSVDRIFDLYGHLRGTAKYFGILSVIRHKIIGHANIALESYNTPLNWIAIKQCLNTHYTDKRDISTLEYQLTTLVQGNNTIETFYQQVYNNFSLIFNNISGQNLDKTTESAIIATYSNKALDTFVRGLNGDLPKLLAVKDPKDLPEALAICTKLANQEFRTRYAYNTQIQHQTPIYSKHATQQNNRRQITNKPFYPQLTHFSTQNQHSYRFPQNMPNQQHYQPNQNQNQQYYTAFNHNQQLYQPFQNPHQQFHPTHNQTQNYQPFNNNQPTYQPPRPMGPKPQLPPEPMDIDRSLRSQLINYANRSRQQQQQQQPQQQHFINKRTNTAHLTNYQQPKQARNFHIDDSQTPNINETQGSHYEYSNPTQEYIDEYEEQDTETNNNNLLDVSDIHFLG